MRVGDECASDVNSPAMKLEEFPPEKCDESGESDEDLDLDDQRNSSIRKKK